MCKRKQGYSKKCGFLIIEFIDVDEGNTSLIVNTPQDMDGDLRYSHCEIHPCLQQVLSVLLSHTQKSGAKKRIWNRADKTICRSLCIKLQKPHGGIEMFFTIHRNRLSQQDYLK